MLCESRSRWAVMFLLVGILILPACAAFGQAIPWQGPPAAADLYSMAQQPAAPATKPPATKPPAAKPEPLAEPIDLFDPSSMPVSQDPLVRLASVPNMFGDSLGMGAGLLPYETTFESLFDPHHTSLPSTLADVRPGGAVRRVKIAENNRALPTDRVYFSYNHFQNAINGLTHFGNQRAISLDQYTMGLEKTFCDGRWSCELRMPFSGAYSYASVDPVLSSGTGHFGNLAVTLKRVIYMSDTCVTAAGLGISTPTGSDASGQVNRARYVLKNETVALLPYIGILSTSYDPLFVQGFLQVDVPLNGDEVVLAGTPIGKYNEQTLLYADIEFGYWLYRNRTGIFSAMAAIVEFHYTTTLQDTDVVAGRFGGQLGGSSLTVANLSNRNDVVNMTLGLHTELGPQTHLGLGVVLPLDDYPNRFFDAEAQVFLNKYF